MIRGIHYFSAEVKTKIDVIPRGCFKLVTYTKSPIITRRMYEDVHVLKNKSNERRTACFLGAEHR